jgi:phosphoribosylformylglycinamidine synthase
VSLSHRAGDGAIHPTPVVGALGVLADVARWTPTGWRTPGLALHLLGVTREELAGSEWAWVVHRHLGGLPPKVDLAAERRLAEVLVQAARAGLLAAAGGVRDGGLAQALVQGVLRFGVGARVSLDGVCARDGVTPFLALFAESTARVVVALPAETEAAFLAACSAAGVPVARLGETTSGAELEVEGVFAMPLDDLRAAREAALPADSGA